MDIRHRWSACIEEVKKHDDMKRFTLYTFSALALLLAATACTQDETSTLTYGTQPLTLTAAIEGSTDTRATVDNRWNGNETIALQVTDGDGEEWYDYTLDDKGELSGKYYWTNQNPITVQGLYPNIMVENNDWNWSVEEDQSGDEAYQSGDLLCSESKTVSFAQTPSLTFYHQTAKVVVNIKQEGLPESIGATPGDISLTIGEGDILALNGMFTLPASADDGSRWLGTWTPGTAKGSISPHLASTPAEGCFATYEALVIPQTVSAGTWLLAFDATKGTTVYGPFYYTLDKDAEWKPGHVYTYDVTIFYYGLEVSVESSIGWTDVADGIGSVTPGFRDLGNNQYEVGNTVGLNKWAEIARSNPNASCTLTNDIDYNHGEWTPIENYTGTFDGGGYTISNIKIEQAGSERCGLFSQINQGGTVKNLNVKSITINNTNSKSFNGGIAGINFGTIEGCTVTDSKIIGENTVGGIVGENNGGQISGCHVEATLSSSNKVGGIVGANSRGSIIASSYKGIINRNNAPQAGGITGFNVGTVTACWADCTFSGTGSDSGGVASTNSGGTITACYWSGNEGNGIGVSFGDTSDIIDVTKVEGTTTWQTAVAGMNTALANAGSSWRWELLDGNTYPTLVPNN